MKNYLPAILLLLLIAACSKEKTDPSKPLRNPANYKAFRQADSACLVNNGTDSIWIIDLHATTWLTNPSNTKYWYNDFTGQNIYLAPNDTFKYNLRLMQKQLESQIYPPYITAGDTTVRSFSFFIFDHYYIDETRNNLHTMSGVEASWP